MAMNAPALLAHAWELLGKGQPTEGLETFRRLTRDFPRYAEGWFACSSTESGMGFGLSAIHSARQALSLDKGNPLYRAQLAQMQVNYGMWGDALETVEVLRNRGPSGQEAKIANAVGSVLSICGRETDAQPWFDAVAAQTPANPNYLYNQAQGLLHCGRLEESRLAFGRLLAQFPDFAKAHWSLSTFDAARGGEERLGALQQGLRRSASPIDEVMYCYALFNALEALGRPREAFEELQHGMRLQRARIRYTGEDAAALGRLGDAGARWLEDSQAMPNPSTTTHPRPLFIVGMPRSGTTLVERILGNHPDVAQGGELTCFPAALREQLGVETVNPMMTSVPLSALERSPSLDLLRARYFESTAYKSEGRACLTDKYPFNFMLVPWIARALPDARILHVRRDPMDTCFSNLKQLFSGAYGACYSQQDIADYFAAYHALMERWDRLLPGRILEVRYEQLVAEPERISAAMFDFCGLTASEGAWKIENNTQPVATASTAQVRQPINARGLGAWRKYEQELQPLFDYFRARPELLQ